MTKFRLSWQVRVTFILLVLVNLPFLFVAQISMNLVENALLSEKENKLLSITHVLDSMLGPKGFDGILQKYHATEAARDEKIAILNSELKIISDSLIPDGSGLAVGYYSKDLDAIVAYGPSKSYAHTVGTSVLPEHPGRTVMSSNTPAVVRGSMVRGAIMNAMYPLEREGRVIGYLWANELETDVDAQLAELTHETQILLLACFLFTGTILFILALRTVKQMDHVIAGVRQLKDDLSYRIPPAKGEFADVVANINDMAQTINKATSESARAITVLQGIMNNMDFAILVLDPKTRRIIYANPYVHKMCEMDDVVNKMCYKVLYNRSEPCEECPQLQFFNPKGEPDFSILHREEFNTALNKEFLVSERLIHWHDDRVVHLRVFMDISERKALEQATSANKAQRDFLARMSHEIRTPMNGVLGMTRLAIQDNPPAKQLTYLKKIQSSASLLLGIINDILDFSRIEAGAMTIEKRPFDIYEAVEKVHELILPRAQENDTILKVDITPNVPQMVEGDSLRFSQVLLNLMGNATKFTKQGAVSLSVWSESVLGGKVRVHCQITDTGIGMTKPQLEELFKPFTQADNSTSRRFGGTGLGLSICKAFVELMHGSIKVSSEEGKGSTFSFNVLFSEHVALQSGDSIVDKPWENQRYDGNHFLLVEDDPINQEVALAVLDAMGIKVDVANNGQEGYEMFMKNDYDLILMDMRMPVMDGLTATRKIRSSGKQDAQNIPILAMTANAMDEDKQESLNAGLNAHISKPIDMEELKRTFYAFLASASSGKLS